MSTALWTVRYGAYPFTMAAALASVAVAPATQLPLLWLAFIAACGLTVVAIFERFAPFKASWLRPDKDFAADIVHAIVNLAVMHCAVLGFVMLRKYFAWDGLWWPAHWPFLAQVFLAGLPLDLSLYLVHRLSHRFGFLWRLHSIHHSSRRLYWLNGERRHPLHAALMAGPGLLVLGLLGAPAAVVAGWLAVLAIHLAFQHANLDYRVGPLRYLIGVAEVHRWHHRERFEDAQVNFGEFWMLWDHCFGTFHRPKAPLGQIGIQGDPVPAGYREQMTYPFRAE